LQIITLHRRTIETESQSSPRFKVSGMWPVRTPHPPRGSLLHLFAFYGGYVIDFNE
jgi:hypothetical protein